VYRLKMRHGRIFVRKCLREVQQYLFVALFSMYAIYMVTLVAVFAGIMSFPLYGGYLYFFEPETLRKLYIRHKCDVSWKCDYSQLLHVIHLGYIRNGRPTIFGRRYVDVAICRGTSVRDCLGWPRGASEYAGNFIEKYNPPYVLRL
jgi:hypothetical protein